MMFLDTKTANIGQHLDFVFDLIKILSAMNILENFETTNIGNLQNLRRLTIQSLYIYVHK